MASIVNALGKHLATCTEVANLLADARAPHGVKVFKGSIPQGMQIPAVTLQAIAATPDYHLKGEIGDLATIVQVDTYAATEAEAEDIAEAIRLEISHYYGQFDETEVKSVTIAADRQLLQEPTDASGRAGWRKSVDYRITHEREVNVSVPRNFYGTDFGIAIGGTPTTQIRPVHIVESAGTIRSFKAGLEETGTNTLVEFDLLKYNSDNPNGVSVLSGVAAITHSTPDRTQVSATISSPAVVEGDWIAIQMTVTSATGAAGPRARVEIDE